jgi:hypothetical protein
LFEGFEASNGDLESVLPHLFGNRRAAGIAYRLVNDVVVSDESSAQPRDQSLFVQSTVG